VSSFPLIHQALRSPFFSHPAGANPLDGGAPYYGVYRCKDGGWFTVGALEPQFYAKFLEGFLPALPADFSVPDLEHGSFWKPTSQKQFDRAQWGDMRRYFEAGFLTRTRDQWTDIFDGE
jgi:alpha-methylacyl-CoA racemase